MKVVIGTKSGKTFQKELSGEEAEALYGRVLGEELRGELLGYSGVTFVIRGGSDSQGFPMRKDLTGPNRKKLLITKGIGFKGKLRGKRFGGLRIKRTVAGNTVHEKIHQVNLKVAKGDAVIEKAFAPAEEEAAPKVETKTEE
jgi:small subunit ribosomal protein S6e